MWFMAIVESRNNTYFGGSKTLGVSWPPPQFAFFMPGLERGTTRATGGH